MEVQPSHFVWRGHSQDGLCSWFCKAAVNVQPTKPSANLFLMTTDRKEPTYVFSEKQVAEKSELARHFLDTRTRLNENVDKAGNFLVKRFYNLDHNTYLEGAVPAKYKELMGLVASACLRCDDCINYHVIQGYRLGVTRAEQEEAINVALVVGGSIVIPHMRRAYGLLTELYG
jgi:AhpD family alkylhydroperoxidase